MKLNTNAKPKTADDWLMLEFEISGLFDGAPISEEDLFAGRSEEVSRILRAVIEKSKHVVLFGERGVGKTSLSNVFWKRYNKTLMSFLVARVQASPADNFSSLWIRALEEMKGSANASGKSDYFPISTDFEVISPSEIRRELAKCSPNALPVIIIDEYDKLEDDDAKALTANLIKELYDYAITTTIILVGVAESIGKLVADHASINRPLVQIPLSRMNDDELREIITSRASRTVMKFDPDSIWTIITLSRGLPFFTQTLSKHAALVAIENKRLTVTNDDVEASMERFIKDTEASFKDEYRSAVQSNQANFFQESLLACALANSDDDGFFTANDVVEPYSAIVKERKRIAHFERHLRRFSGDEGGNILISRGGDRRQTFRFSDPMMQPYVIIRGIQKGMIDEAARSTLLQREQGVFPI